MTEESLSKNAREGKTTGKEKIRRGAERVMWRHEETEKARKE
jgi:hypothetical protein